MPSILKIDIAKHPIYWASLVVLAISAVFLVIPEIDVWVSSLFYDLQNQFWVKSLWFPNRLRELGIFTPRLIVALLTLFLFARLLLPQLKKLFALSYVLFLLLSAAIGPGLLVNVLLKDHWGRARPVQTDLFGGDWPYSHVWVIADNCQKNCSFVSGEGSMSMWLFGLLLLLPLGWRKVSFWIITSFAMLISFNRIAFGGHYLSDILLSWALTAWVMVLLLTLFRKSKSLGFESETLEIAWDAAGLWLDPRLKAAWENIKSRVRKR